MHIVNAMFGQGLGGIEQAFVDYTMALTSKGHTVTSLVHPKAKVIPRLAGTPVRSVRNWGEWDLLAIHRIRRELASLSPDVVIAQGGRAIVLLRKAAQPRIPVIGVCHNYSLSRSIGCDALITVTDDLSIAAAAQGQQRDKIFVIPNMIAMPSRPPSLPKARHSPPVVGALGRFVAKKGFLPFVEALRVLNRNGVAFHALLGGDGPDREALKMFIRTNDLDDIVTMPGWIVDKEPFFEAIDIFCVPSLSEPFGIVILEAFVNGVPVVSTECQGPREIIKKDRNGIIVPPGDIQELSKALQLLLSDKLRADDLAKGGYEAACESYAMNRVADRIERAVLDVLRK